MNANTDFDSEISTDDEQHEPVNIGSSLLSPDLTVRKMERVQGFTPTEIAEGALPPEEREPIEAVDLPGGKTGDVDDDRFDKENDGCGRTHEQQSYET